MNADPTCKHFGALAMRHTSESTLSTTPSALRRAVSGFLDYVVDVLTAVQNGRQQHPVISAYKA